MCAKPETGPVSQNDTRSAALTAIMCQLCLLCHVIRYAKVTGGQQGDFQKACTFVSTLTENGFPVIGLAVEHPVCMLHILCLRQLFFFFLHLRSVSRRCISVFFQLVRIPGRAPKITRAEANVYRFGDNAFPATTVLRDNSVRHVGRRWTSGESLSQIGDFHRCIGRRRKITSRPTYRYIVVLESQTSSEEIKKAFRKLSFEFHPDQAAHISTEEEAEAARQRYDEIVAACVSCCC